MTRHLLHLMWNRKRQNLLLTLEILLSFAVLFVVVYFVALNAYFYWQPLGFNPDRVWVIEVRYPDSGPIRQGDATPEVTARRAIAAQRFDQIRRALATLPNVEKSTASWPGAIYENGGWRSGLGPAESSSWINVAGDDFADVLGIRIVSGRWFSRQDDGAGYQPIVVNRRLAKALFGDRDPLNQVVEFARKDDNNSSPMRVVGVVDEFRQGGEFGAPTNYSFLRLDLNDPPKGTLPNNLTIKVTPGTTAEFEAQLVETLQPIAPDWTFDVRSAESRRETLASRSLGPLAAMGILAVFLLLMVGLGLTGVVWQSVTARIQEFGLRRAKGATARDVRRQVLTELALMTTLAISVALVVLVQVPVLATMPSLIELPMIPLSVYVSSVAISVAVIYLVTLLCGWYPSRLATRIQPAEALHYE